MEKLFLVFTGEVKSGSRPARKNNTQNPEPDVYATEPGTDMKLRLLGHWGSKVYYRNPQIKFAKPKKE